MNDIPTLLTLKLFSAKYPSFSTLSLRNMVFYAKTTGFHVCVVRVGKRVFLDEAKFFQWIADQQPSGITKGVSC